MDSRESILASLLGERTVDIVTTGRRSGAERITEIWTTPLIGRLFIVGTPNAGKPGIERQPRDWLANLVAMPDFVVRLKTSVHVDLAARATPVRDPEMRHEVLSAPSTAYYRDKAPTFEAALRYSPMVDVTFTGDAAWLVDALAKHAD